MFIQCVEINILFGASPCTMEQSISTNNTSSMTKYGSREEIEIHDKLLLLQILWRIKLLIKRKRLAYGCLATVVVCLCFPQVCLSLKFHHLTINIRAEARWRKLTLVTLRWRSFICGVLFEIYFFLWLDTVVRWELNDDENRGLVQPCASRRCRRL